MGFRVMSGSRIWYVPTIIALVITVFYHELCTLNKNFSKWNRPETLDCQKLTKLANEWDEFPKVES
eukprot:2274848-Rhodomonas_salina.1